jgi:PAS domain S-box-containing protein
MSVGAHHHDVAVLLRAEHEVGHVLAETADEAAAYRRLLEAIGASLAWEVGALWTVEEKRGGDAVMRCVEVWRAAEPVEAMTRRGMTVARGLGLPGRVWASGRPAWIVDVGADPRLPRRASAVRAGLRTAFCFPIRGTADVLGAMEFLARERREPDEELLTTMTSLGERIGQCFERWRAEDRLRESDARKTAILNAAFDCIITMDADGRIVEVNRATERTFGYRAEELVGRELAELIIPPSLREAHRSGVERYVTTGHGRIVGHPVELFAMRADGSEFPVEVAITRPDLPGRLLFTGYIRDVTDRHRDELVLRGLADEQAALRHVATVVAAAAEPERVFATVTEEAGRILGAQTSNMIRFEPDGTAIVVGEWSTGTPPAVPVGTPVALDGDTLSSRIHRRGRPARVDDYTDKTGTTADMLRALGYRAAVGAPITLAGSLWGAVMVATGEDQPFAEGSEQRMADFAELVALALGNTQSREQLAASRARIVEAGDAERRRLERNLHDGAQQRLVALSLLLRRAEAAIGDEDPGLARALLQHGIDELGDALEELRELAHGIHPAVLTDHGLVAALKAVAGRATVPVELSMALDERLPAAVEAAAYYLVAEAVTNASKHAGASVVHVRVAGTEGGRAVVIEVADDGVGGAELSRGSGLRGLRDRVEALGGVLRMESPLGGGTRLRARMPVRPKG